MARTLLAMCFLASAIPVHAGRVSFVEEQASVLYSMASFSGSGEVHLVRSAAPISTRWPFELRFYTSHETNSLALVLPAHESTVFRIAGNILYCATFAVDEPGCSVLAFDLMKREPVWHTYTKGTGVDTRVRSSLFYSHAVNLNVNDSLDVQIVARESDTEYVEVLDRRDGTSLEHRTTKIDELLSEKNASSSVSDIDDQTQERFATVVRDNHLRKLSSVQDRDIVAELWQIQVTNRTLSGTWLLKSESGRAITGGGVSSGLTNTLGYSTNIIHASEFACGTVWPVDGSNIVLPRPYGLMVGRTFPLPSPTLEAPTVSLLLMDHLMFDGDSGTGEVHSFSFESVHLPE